MLGAQRLAERLREMLSNLHAADVAPGQFRVTLSQGVAGVKASRHRSATDLLLAADRALYTATEASRRAPT